MSMYTINLSKAKIQGYQVMSCLTQYRKIENMATPNENKNNINRQGIFIKSSFTH